MVNQDILRLEVTEDEPVFVKMLDSDDQLRNEEPGLAFGEFGSFRDVIIEVASWAELLD